MPRTIAIVSLDANPQALDNVLAIIKNPDLLAVAGFAAIGLLVTIGLTVFLPLSDDVAALASLLG
ncbi:MAG: hypothetical protein ABSC37_03550 [Xanthobacteraceae bacterium]